jgi:hypothetical protein
VLAGSVSLVLHEEISFDINEIHGVLLDTELSILRQGDNIAVWWEGGPLLFITSAVSETIRKEATLIGQGTPYADILSQCAARIEITFDDLEEVRTEIDTLIEVQETLQDATQGFIFNAWNGKLAPPPLYQQ